MEKKIKRARLLRIGVLIVLAIGLFLDYFPHLVNGGLGARGTFILILVAFVFAVAAEFMIPREKRKRESIPLWEHDLFFIFYVIGLIALLTFAGGESQVGLHITHPILWVFVVYAFIKWNLDRKRHDEDEEKE
ncbi:hypothetical protein [Bacillus sp. FJAT-45037]|uniref:hypothetical protein n=1 Tax=Bacillus sp. FJAT-45037 TaxID=2011007 RepID=UPI000C2307C5|nr:hypothetical protein [Bacillus sp. FJAT-45037]